jgi:predicted transcriptional regulator
MVTITVTLSEDRLQKLQRLAKQFNIPTEELLRVSLEELIARPQEDFQKALKYVLEKNKELYKKLAQE